MPFLDNGLNWSSSHRSRRCIPQASGEPFPSTRRHGTTGASGEVGGNASDWGRYPIASSPRSVSVTFSLWETCSSVILPWDSWYSSTANSSTAHCAKVGGNKYVTRDKLLGFVVVMKYSGIAGGSAAIGGSHRDDWFLSSVFRIKPRVQRLPIDHEFAAGGFVLLRPSSSAGPGKRGRYDSGDEGRHAIRLEQEPFPTRSPTVEAERMWRLPAVEGDACSCLGLALV